MKSEKFKILEKHIDSFPVLPVTVTRLLQVVSNPESSAHEVMETILPDQSLCLTILKFANSVLFGRPQKIDSLTQAIAFLGFDEVQNIALSKALINSFGELEKRHLSSLDRFWQHSFICAMAARHIAHDLKLRQDVAFTSGLIHDIGKLIILKSFEDEYSPQKWMTEFSSEEKLHDELKLFSFTHDMVGGQLLRKWHFPEVLITAVVYHHRPGNTSRDQIFAYVVQLADILSFYSCNQDLIGEEKITSCVHTALPQIKEKWRAAGLNWNDKAIENWYEWLVLNHEDGNNLREIIVP